MSVRVNPLVGATLVQLTEAYAKQCQTMQWLINHDEGDTERMAAVVSRQQDICAEWGRRGRNVAELRGLVRDDYRCHASNIGGWKRCTVCGNETWQTEAGACLACANKDICGESESQ